MGNYLDPIAAIEQPRADYIRYLLSAYPIKERELREKLKSKLEQPGNVWQHPYIEGAQPYQPGKEISELVTDGILHPRITELFSTKRRLYQHQEAAITAVTHACQNIVVATGTGSGKTECFLVPMMDGLLKEEEKLSDAGVRALILYPMNALVNDQVKRLRQILCHQNPAYPLIRFGFYTSRTDKDPQAAEIALRDELTSYDAKDLQALFTKEDLDTLKLTTREKLVDKALERIQSVQALSRQEIQDKPPHILVTNYSMLEHMLIRPREKGTIFKESRRTFNTLIVDEAHTYDGSTGTEVSMLLNRLKVALGKEKGQIRCIATSASLGEKEQDNKVLEFASNLFDEQIDRVVRGNRQSAKVRLGDPSEIDWQPEEVLEVLSSFNIPASNASLDDWISELRYLIADSVLDAAISQAGKDFNKLLWYALKQHPLIHRAIDILGRSPLPWHELVRSVDLWQMELPQLLNQDVDPEFLDIVERALSKLLQIGSLAKENSEDLPLLPIRIHLLFRSLEGVYNCINPKCREVYLNEKHTCDRCQSPVVEVGSCSQCGEVYFLSKRSSAGQLLSLPRTNQACQESKDIYTLTLEPSAGSTEDEDDDMDGESEESPDSNGSTFIITKTESGWSGEPRVGSFTQPEKDNIQVFNLVWHRHKDDKGIEGRYLNKCVACGSTPNRSLAINRFITYTDAPLVAAIDSLFHLLPETKSNERENSQRKLLTFSDSRQDAAFFASDFQRSHTESLYRQMLWQALGRTKDTNGISGVERVTDALANSFLETSIVHPDRDHDFHHKSYHPQDPIDGRQNENRCQEMAKKRAKEILIREFAIPFARRTSLESYALAACHIPFKNNDSLVTWTAEHFEIFEVEAIIFLTRLTDIIRRSGIISIAGASSYFPETGGNTSTKRPEIIDRATGKSKRELFLEKPQREGRVDRAFLDSQSFLPKLKKAQNRLGWYFSQIFPTLPSKESLVALFEQMRSSGILVKANTGFHLKWDLCNIEQTTADWYKCDRCQQIIHIPHRSELQESILRIDRCHAYRCEGKLHPHTTGQIDADTAEHYDRYLLQHRQEIIPLRSQEHTAQLGTDELAARENNFRQGKINLLSCSTTLEMGVDIGELQAVVLRNFPPHVSNYQQRAGRAGRRTDGVAITLMYGQRRPHDRFYFEEPERLIAGQNRIPSIERDNLTIQKRHIYAELISEFLLTKNIGVEKVNIGIFLGLSADRPEQVSRDNFNPNLDSTKLLRWIEENSAKNLTTDWLKRLERDSNPNPLLNEFNLKFQEFIDRQLEDWNEIVKFYNVVQEDLNNKPEIKVRKQLEYRRDNLERELQKIAKRQLHEQLVQSGVLPIYGFPVDVVRLLTDSSNEFRSNKGKHRLERDRRMALSEYAPGQEIIVDDRVHRSVGIVKHQDLEEKHYWVCKHCNHFPEKVGIDNIEECPVCKKAPERPRDQKTHLYRVPKAFTTDWSATLDVVPYHKPSRRPTSQVFLANAGQPSELYLDLQNGFYKLTSGSSGKFFLANRGFFVNGENTFHLCDNCGRDLTEDVLSQQNRSNPTNSNNTRPTHKHPITGRECRGRGQPTHLGHEFNSDLLKVEFLNSPPGLFELVNHYQGDRSVGSNSVELKPNQISALDFWYSLTYSLLAAASSELDIRREELDGLFQPLANSNGIAEIVIYDNVPGGAGYSRKIADSFNDILVKAYQIVSTCSCEKSCYDCLRTYSNQAFHDRLDRQVIADFLQPMIDIIKPDVELEAFAKGSTRVNCRKISDDLPAYCRSAQSGIFYIPDLQASKLSIPWMERLTEVIEGVRKSKIPLVLVLGKLLQPSDESGRFIRKRLRQWMEEDLLNLYTTSSSVPTPILMLQLSSTTQIAMKLKGEDSKEWLQTRTNEGAEQIRQKTNGLRDRLITIEELADRDTQIIYLKADRQYLSTQDLVETIGFSKFLGSSQIIKLAYRDRYLNGEGANILANLLLNQNITEATKFIVDTKEHRQGFTSSTERKLGIEKALGKLGTQLKITIYPERSNLEHSRVLEIWQSEGEHHRVIFDSGLDFIQQETDNVFTIKKPTYIVFERVSQ